MPTVSDEAKAALKKNGPRTLRVLKIVKEFYDADLRETTDVTERVSEWGTITGESTFRRKDWQIPQWTVVLQNTDNYFSRYNAASLWKTGLVRDPELCFAIFQYKIVLQHGTKRETLWTWFGKIQDMNQRDDGGAKIVELEMLPIWEDPLRAEFGKDEGDSVIIPAGQW